MPEKLKLGVVVLAAGASSRMGRPKMLLPWDGNTVLGRIVQQWREICAAQIAVACAAGDLPLAIELDRLEVPQKERIINPDPRRGMFSSVQCAARWNCWNMELTHVVIALGDQPHLASETLRTVADIAVTHPQNICQPSYNGRSRHPVFLPRHIFQLIATTGAGTLKEFLAGHASTIQKIESKDPGLDLDLDTPEDYERAQRQFLRSRQGTGLGPVA